MSDKRERETRVLVGALNWLINKYDVGNTYVDKDHIRRIITKVLMDYDINGSDALLFKEDYLDRDIVVKIWEDKGEI